MSRNTHLLESHVSGQMVKREVTEEGEVATEILSLKYDLYIKLNVSLKQSLI